MPIFDPRSFRRVVAGLAMIVGPALLLASELIHPERDNDEAEQLSIVTANAQQWYLSHALLLVSLALAVPALLGLMHLLRPVRPTWGHAGATLAVLGLVPLAALLGTEFVVWQMTALEQGMVPLLERLNESLGIGLLFLFALLFVAAWLVLALGLWLGRVVPIWQAALIGLANVVFFAGTIAPSKVLTLIAAAAFLVGLAPLGWRLLAQTDEQWEAARAAPTS